VLQFERDERELLRLPWEYLTDPDGLVIQLQDHRYRGGCGFLGEHTGTPKYPSDKK